MNRRYNKQPKLHIKVGDDVIVTAGNHKNKKGKILKILVEKSRVVIEGVNMLKKHIKPSAQSPQGGIVETEGSVHISNVMLIDPKSGEPTRIGRKEDKSTGKLKRYSKKSGEFIL